MLGSDSRGGLRQVATWDELNEKWCRQDVLDACDWLDSIDAAEARAAEKQKAKK